MTRPTCIVKEQALSTCNFVHIFEEILLISKHSSNWAMESSRICLHKLQLHGISIHQVTLITYCKLMTTMLEAVMLWHLQQVI